MPSQSGDPIATALQTSLAGSGSACRAGREDDLSLYLSYSAKQILLNDSDIDYVQFKYDSTSFLNDLKSKYTVISEKDEVQENKAKVSDKGKPAGSSVRTPGLPTTTPPTPGLPTPSLPAPHRTLWPPDAVDLGWKPNTPVGGGFINLWNSCYINSTLQALFHIPCFANWLLMDNSHKCTKGSTECIICAMTHTLKNSQESTGRAIKPYLVYSKLKGICKHLNPGTQEDAHEFLRHLVDALDRTYLAPFRDLRLDHLSKETTPLSQIFGGYLRSEVECGACRHVSTTFQYFQDLPLDIGSPSCTHLEAALTHFFAKESVSEHEGYKCQACKKKVPFTKKFSLEKPPKVLCIQLKRFGATSGKNNKCIMIAGKLQLNRFRAVRSGESFEPYHFAAVINHLGSSASCGHYTAIAQAPDSKFYLFDDSRVERLHDLQPNSSQAYILLYHQKPSASKTEVSSKIIITNSMKNSLQPSCSTARERLFGKESSLVKTPFKLINKVANTVSSVFTTKVNGETSSGPSSGETSTGSSSGETRVKPGQAPVERETSTGLHCKPTNGQKSHSNKSLVPYNESSSSSDEGSVKGEQDVSQVNPDKVFDRIKKEEENECSPSPSKKQRLDDSPRQANTTPPHNPTVKVNGISPGSKTNGISPGSKTNGISPVNNTNGNSPGNKPNGVSPAKVNGVSPVNRQNGTVVRSSGNWTVTSRSPSCSPDKSESTGSSWKVKGSEEKDYRSNLMSLSHRGYGKPVATWSGEKSEIDREVSRESSAYHRVNSYNDSYDMPNKKRKMRRENNHHSSYNKNRFNDAQKRKNWFNNSNGYHRSYPGKRRNTLSTGGDYYSKYSSYSHWDHH